MGFAGHCLLGDALTMASTSSAVGEANAVRCGPLNVEKEAGPSVAVFLHTLDLIINMTMKFLDTKFRVQAFVGTSFPEKRVKGFPRRLHVCLCRIYGLLLVLPAFTLH